jgi:hypothetical protein
MSDSLAGSDSWIKLEKILRVDLSNEHLLFSKVSHHSILN